MKAGRAVKVLIVEDSLDDALLLVDELKRGGFSLTYKRVESGKAFSDELSRDWGVIIADYSLPRFSGEDALNMLNESGRDIPLIILSGSITDEIAVRLLKHGAKDFITKDNMSRLVTAVQRELDEAEVRKTQRELQQALVDKEALIQSFFNSADEPFILLDSDFRFLQVNPSYERRVGMSNEQLRGRKISEIVPDIKASGRLAQYAKVIQTGNPLSFSSIVVYTPIFGARTVNVRAFKVGGGVGLVITDITEQKKLEKEKENTNRLNEALGRLYVPLTDPQSSIREIAEHVLNEAMVLTGSAQGYVSEVDAYTGNNIGHTLTSMMPNCDVPEKRIEFPKNPDGSYASLWGYALTTKKPFYTNDPQKHPSSNGTPLGHIPIERFLAVPVLIKDGLVGQIALANPQRDYSDNDLIMIARIAELYGTAIMRKRIQSALSRSEAEKSSILNSMKDIVSLTDRDYTLLWGNDALFVNLGKPVSELVGKKCYAASYNREEPCENCGVEEVFKTGKGARNTRRFVDGSIRETWSEPVRDETGKITAVIEISRDITDLMRYEERLEALHKHTVKLSQAQSIKEISDISLEVMSSIFQFKFISYLEVQGATLVGIGSKGAPLTGLPLPLNGKGITVKAANTKKAVRVNELRQDATFFKGSTDSLSELAVPVLVDDQTVAVLNAESDKINSFNEQDQRLLEILASHVASAIQRIKSREQLSDAEMLTQIIMNEIPDGIYLTDLNENILEVNQSIPKILGYTRSELIGRKTSTIEDPKYHNKFTQIRANLLKTGRNIFETEATAKNGEKIPVEISTRLITYKGKPAVIGVSRDLRERRREEAKLRESEERYRTILENTPNPISITVDGKIVYANPERIHLSGATKFEELEGRTALDYIHPDDVHRMNARNSIRLEEGDPPLTDAFRIRKSDGTYANIESISTPIKFKGQQAVLHVLHDVTQQRKYEEKLAGLHEYARNLAMATTLYDASRVVGEAVQDMIETSFGSIGIVEGDLIRFLHVYGVDWNEGETMPLNGTGITTRAARTGETQIVPDVLKDKDYFFAYSKLSKSRSEVVVPIKGDGKVVAVINVEDTRIDAFTSNDVQILEILGNHFATAIQRIKVTQGVKNSEEKYRNLFEGVNDAVFIHRPDGKFIEVNEVACKRLGYTRDELLKLRFSDIDADPDPAFLTNVRKTLDETGNTTFETTHKAKNGDLIDIEINAHSITFEGEPATLSTCRDIRERKKMERGLATIHTVVSLLATVNTISEVWDITLNTLETILGQHWANINVVQGDHLVFVESIGASPPLKIKNLPLDGPGITVRAITSGKTQLIPNVLVDPDYVASYSEDDVTYPTRSELATPILIDGKAYAVINLESKALNDFTSDDLKLMEILAGHVGEAIKRIQSIEELVIGEEQLATLHKFTNRLAEAKTFDDAAVVAADSITTLLNTTTGSLAFVENGSLHHRYVYGVKLEGEFVQPLDGPGITVRAVVTGEPQLIPDIRKDASFQVPGGIESTTLSELAVPVKLEGQVVAVINAENPELEAYTVRDQRILEILAMHLSSAFARIRENESKENYRYRLEALHKLVTQLDTAQTPTEVAVIAYDMLQSLTDTKYARLGLIEGDVLSFIDIPNVDRRMIRLPLNGRGITIKAVRERRTIVAQDVKADPDFVKGSLETNSEVAIPIFIANRVVGVLNINSILKNAFRPEDVKLDETIAMHISSTLERLQIDAERLESRLAIQRKEYEAEQARELERMKTRFISTATHEIRTPLTSIKGYTELIQGELERGNLDTTKNYFDVVARNVNRLIHLTDDLLDTQRIDEKRMVLNPTAFKVKTFLKDLEAEMTPLLKRRNQILDVMLKIKGDVYGDPNRLMQVLINLISNSSKLSPTGSTIYLSVERQEGDVLFSVKDAGVGLSADDVSKLFQPFPGIHVEGNPEGTGLGLSICRGIVEMHGGKIWAESEGRGRGAKFSFTIPEEKK